MKTKSGNQNQAPATGREQYTTGFVTSKDGTTIGYRQLGSGPGVVLLHGSMSSSHNHMQLAELLAGSFTVYIPDRRGRGLSGQYGKNFSIQEDVDDLDALLTKTGAHKLFGLSSGAIILLQAALTLPAIHKAAIFEPPLFNSNTVPVGILTRFNREMAQGKVAAAMITGMKGAQMGPPVFNYVPRLLLELMVNMAMAQEAKKGSGGYVPMKALAPTLHYDFQIVAEMSGKLESFRAMPAEILLLGGSKSPAYLKAALDTLEKIIPRVKRVEFAGLGHAASWNNDRGGQPEPVAQELRRFFS
jgi:pimeloyl-ACP methyl ester carboxylesterase